MSCSNTVKKTVIEQESKKDIDYVEECMWENKKKLFGLSIKTDRKIDDCGVMIRLGKTQPWWDE